MSKPHGLVTVEPATSLTDNATGTPATDTQTRLLHFPQPSVSSAALVTPGQPIPAPRIPQSAPDAMVPDSPYSLLDDIRQQQTQHSSPKERVALHGFPSYITTNIRRVLARNRTRHADWSIALSCLLWRGLCRYSALPAAQALSTALTMIDTDDGIGTLAGEQVEIWRRGFRFSIADPTHTMGVERVRSWKAPEHVHSELYDLAGRLGLSGGTLGIVSVMAGLHDQEGVLGDHARYMRDSVEQLDSLLVERGRRLQGLVTAIGAGVWD